MKGFSFNGKHSAIDFGLLLESYTIGTPTKKKTTIEVPYRNGSIDVSTINTLGENTYTDREIQIKLSVVTKNLSQLNVKYNRIMEWLIDTVGRKDLIFDDTLSYCFKAEVVSEINFDTFFSAGTFTIKMVANPFRYGTSPEGTLKEWDTFNFEEDILQDTIISSNESKEITIINTGRTIIPTFKVTKGWNITITKGTYTTPIIPINNEYTDYNISFKNGENNLIINGTGTVEIIFNKEAF